MADLTLHNNKETFIGDIKRLKQNIETPQVVLYGVPQSNRDHPLDVLRIEVPADDGQQNGLRRQKNNEEPPLS